MQNKQEEWLDIVNEDDNVIGMMSRSDAYEQKLYSSLRTCWLMIKNSEGKLWIPRRHLSKKILPGGLDGSAVGHVSAGESYKRGLIRETEEEVGVDLTKVPYKLLGKLDPQKDKSLCFAHVYEIELDDVPDWNKDDFVEFFWLTPQEVLQKIEEGHPAKSTLSIILKKFYI